MSCSYQPKDAFNLDGPRLPGQHGDDICRGDGASLVDLSPTQQDDQNFGKCVGDFLTAIQTYQLEFDVENVSYPSYDPPLRHLLARSDPRCKIGSSVLNVCSVGSTQPMSLIKSYVKDLTLYDVHSGVLVLPWCGFGKSAFAFVFSDLILVDNAGNQYECNVKIGVMLQSMDNAYFYNESYYNDILQIDFYKALNTLM
ncbi:hypothetical protein P8452_62939 [Trifolium repens]|nr:hypothetical protein P8452_62939 [Trifolium repens]